MTGNGEDRFVRENETQSYFFSKMMVGKDLQIEQVDLPKPGKGEILIRIDSSPVNPSDNSFLRGMYGSRKTPPIIPGFEASGKVLASGNDFMARRLLGKNVACFAPMDGNGTWAEYMVTRANMAIPLKKEVDLEQGLVFGQIDEG